MLKVELEKLVKEQQEKIEQLENDVDYYEEEVAELEEQIRDYENAEAEVVDIKDFRFQLLKSGLLNDKLDEFINTYMRWYK